MSRTRTPAFCAQLATRNIAKGIHAEGTAIHGRNNGLDSTRSSMKKLLYRRSVARPFVPRKKQLGVLSILFFWLSGADNRRCTVPGPMRRVDCVGMDCVGKDGWVDAATAPPHATPSSSLPLPRLSLPFSLGTSSKDDVLIRIRKINAGRESGRARVPPLRARAG